MACDHCYTTISCDFTNTLPIPMFEGLERTKSTIDNGKRSLFGVKWPRTSFIMAYCRVEG